MRFSKICFCIFSILSLFFFSCHQQPAGADAPAYHNPLVAPLTEALSMDRENPELLFRRSQALVQVNALELAEKDLKQALSKDSDNLKFLYAMGQLNISLNHTKDAIHNLQSLLSKAPGSGPAKLLLAHAYIQNQQPEKAIEEINFILEADSAYPGALYTLAKVKLLQGDTVAANTVLKNALQLRSDDYQASLMLADNLATQHDKGAIEQYRATFDMDTTDVTPLVSLGVFFEKEKQIPKAKTMYKESLLKDPDCTMALMNMGRLLLAEDSLPKALRQFKLAAKTQPNSADAYYHIGLCFEKLNRKDSAQKAFGQAAVFEPDNQEIKKAWQRNATKEPS